MTYFAEDKRYVAGVVHTYLLEGAAGPVYGIQFYPQDVIREAAVVEAVLAVRRHLRVDPAPLAFVLTGVQQTTTDVADDLAAEGIEVLGLDRILGAITYLPLNLGEAWGVLRVFPTDLDGLRPTDIPVLTSCPWTCRSWRAS